LSFDTTVFFSALPANFAESLQASLRELAINDTVHVPADWEQLGAWHLLDTPTASPEASFRIDVQKLAGQPMPKRPMTPDEAALLSKAHYSADVSTPLSGGSFALMIAGAIAKATDGVMFDPQGAAFEPVFAGDLAAHVSPRGASGTPSLAERGFYDTALAWQVAKAASALQARQAQRKHDATKPPVSPPKDSSRSGLYVLLGLLAAGGLFKLMQRKQEKK
jgi:hypothetical protein